MRHESEDAAYTELEPDAWHQNDEGNYSIDCPECGSEATLMNVVKHGRCNGYLSKHDDVELDTQPMDCTAKLWFELGYVSDPDESMTDDAVGEDDGETDSGSDDEGVESEEGVPASDSPAGAEGTVDDDQQ